MFPLGARSVRVFVVGKGESPLAQFTRRTDGDDHQLDVEVGSPAAVRDDGFGDSSVDCLVVDGSLFNDGGVDLVGHARETAPDLSVLLLVDGEYADVVPAALAAGATDTLPRSILRDDPELLADRITAIVERDLAHDGFRDVYEDAAGTVSIHDPETGRMLDANRTLCDLLGRDREALRSLTIGDITADLPGYDQERATTIVGNVSAQDRPIEIEWPLESADGTVRWVDARFSPVTIGGREFVLSAATEITEQRRQEHEYEQIFDAVNDVISVHDPWAEALLDVNQTLCDLTGYSHEALLEMDLDGFSATEKGFTGDRAYEIQQRVAATGEPETVEWQIETAAGDRRRLESVLSPATIAGEDRVLALSRDVTQRRQLERTYRELFEGVSDALVVHDPDSGEIVDVNERYCDLTKYDREELVGSNVRLIVPDDAAYTFDEALTRIEKAREEGPQLFEFKGQRKDGDTFMGEIHLSTVEIRGAERVLASVRDVTDRKRRERAIHELQAATERMQDAESADAVAETAVEAAAEALDLPVAACWFHDPDGERLDLVAATDAVEDREGLSPLTADRYEYEAFRDGDGLQYPPEKADPDNPLETDMLLPLANHGLIAAGSPAQSAYDQVTLDVARTLAEQTATALDRIEREREVRESERRLRIIAERIDQVIFLAEPDFSEAFYVNDAYEDVWGRPVEELLDAPRGFIDYIDGRDREAFEADFERMLDDFEAGDPEDSYEFEYRIRRPDGEVRWVRATGYPVKDDGDDLRFVGIVEDVTERRELEQTYRSVFENVSDGLVVHDPETGKIDDVNDRFCEMNGYNREELLGETVDLVTGPDHAYEDVMDRIARARERDSQLFEWQNQRRDGETFPVEVHLSVVEIRGVERVLASVRDITERKRREREYEQIFNSVQDAIIVMDQETLDILDANEAYLDMVGYEDLETVQERGVEGLSATTEGYTFEEGLEVHRQVAETGEPALVEWQAETKEGERRELEIKVAPAVIGGEEVNVAIHRDVTERKRREREFEQIFHGVKDIINVYDPETAELVEVNDTMCELTGYDRETILEGGLDAVSAVDEGYTAERGSELIEGVMESGESRELEWRLETADGDRRWLEVKATPATINGEDRVLTISRDVTERERSERRLRAILDRIDEAIFLARAHEITQGSQDPDYVSAGYADIWGQPLDGIRDRYENGFFGTVHPDDESDYRAFVNGIVDDIDRGAAADRYSTEYRIETPEGAVRWVQSDYYPVEWESGQPRIVIVSRDVTERKDRERRLVSFEAATDDLATVDAPEEAAKTAVNAATNTLDLSAVGVFLYEEDEGVLKPEGRSDALPDTIGDRAVGPDDGSLWDAFATGNVVSADEMEFRVPAVDEDTTSDSNEVLEDWRLIPLGNHGVLFVGSADSSLDPDTIQSAHVLGATLEAALNHLRGQQRLASREAELRTETERAERLDRIARLTQQVEAAITEGSAPSEVERAVCERLADTDPYEVAWIGGVEVGTDRIVPQTVIGESSRYVGAMDLLTSDEAADRHPAVEAWQTDGVQVASSLVGAGPAGEWRQHVLSRGYQSIIGIPLTYDGITHGVLTIAADSPNAFGDRARSVLEQLGTSIGHALAGIKRRQALESDETVELEFTGSGTALQFAQAASEAGCAVRHERTVHREDGDVSVYYLFDGELPDDLTDVSEDLFPGQVNIVRDGADSVLVEVVTDAWFGSPLAEFGAVLRRAEATPGGTTVVVELPVRSDVRSFTERLQELAPSLELEAKRQHQGSERTTEELRNRIEERLTDRQHEVLRTAFAAGYFEWPRENDGSEVANRLDITQPTFNKHLRMAERKTFGALLGSET
ncbi:MAG: PAS domain S-box-containing protein [Halobacteriales archaeon]|jgi:PAS domain S-box-containing protein